MPTGLEDPCFPEAVANGERLAVGAVRPLDRDRVLVVVLGPRGHESARDRQRAVPGHHDALLQESLVVAAAIPVDGIWRDAALAPDRGVAVEDFDQPIPDQRLVDN
jgi:hypothetical protein